MEQQVNNPSASGQEHLCTCCERVFPTAERLAVHVKVHRGGPKRPLKCKECPRTFPRIDKLRAHQLVHRVGKPHKCEICSKAFTHKQTLVEHLLRHTGVRLQQCDLCPKSFYFRSDLASHRRRHTGERPYECSVCQHCFTGRADLLRHERSHNGDRPYRCTVCKRGFGRNSILERHMMRHTGERPYKCHLCPNTFTRLYLLLEHRKNHPQPQRNLGHLVKRREMRGRPQQRRTANRAAAATASVSVVPGASPTSASPLSAQEVAADTTFTVPEEKPKLTSTQEPAAIPTLGEQPKETPSPQRGACSSKVKRASKSKAKKGRVKTTRSTVRSLSGDCTLLEATQGNTHGPSLSSSEDQNSLLQDHVQGRNQQSAICNNTSLKNLKNRQRKQQQKRFQQPQRSEVSGISSATVNNRTPSSPSFSTPQPIADALNVKQGSRAEDVDLTDTVTASPLSPEAHTTNLTARAQPLHNTVGVFKILPAGSDSSEPGPIMPGLMVPPFGDSSLFLSSPVCEQPPQHVPKDVTSMLHYQDLPCSHEASKAEPEAVLGLSCPLLERHNLQETSSEPSAELKNELNLMRSLSSCPVVPEDMGRHSSNLSATLNLVSTWSKHCILPKDSSS
ncbi:zinc finger protein 358 [Rhipicephalus sanguineus]|uniref:zinc finger protein 358 n=1 Tax=Rhipicephalus sanguineus TaxID=34632 RepID=UPI001894BC31|nr:zinc finger protein 358 [Rhipicephalus sanguineus]